MRRAITGFRQDEDGDWIADLECLHSQHVRHRPPFWDRPWVLSESGRAGRVGAALECPLCDRTELPEGLRVFRTAGPFDESSTPTALRRDHQVAGGTWGRLRVLDGTLEFAAATTPPLQRKLVAGDQQPIPPQLPHHVTTNGAVLFALDFLTR